MTTRKCVFVLTGIAMCCAATMALAAAKSSRKTTQQASLALLANQSLGLAASSVETLNIDAQPEMPIQTQVTLNGIPYTLDLQPQSIRADGYQLLVQGDDGLLQNVEPGPVRTLRGSLLEVPNSIAAATLLENGLYATVKLPNGTQWWVEPIHGRVKGANPNHHVVYQSQDIIAIGGICGTQTPWGGEVQQKNEGGIAGSGGVCAEGVHCTLLACDSDVEYFQDYGSVYAVQYRIISIVNALNVQYESDVCISHRITAIIVRTAEPDPYNSTDSSALLSEFTGHWNGNMGHIERDVAEIFTGKEIDGNVIGVAWWTAGGWICTSNAYNMVQSDCCGSFGCATDLSAHELGHNWGAQHCGCPQSTMNPFIQCQNNFILAPDSVAQIVAARENTPCIEVCDSWTTTMPFVDTFPGTIIDWNKWATIEGQASVDGLNPPSDPYSLNLDGSSTGGNINESRSISFDGGTALTLEYWYQRTGGGDSTEAGDDLIFEYRNSAGTWVEFDRQFGNGPDMTTFEYDSATIADSELHSAFRFRIRANSTTVGGQGEGSDDWFVDDVSLTYIAPPSNQRCTTAIVVPAGSTPFTTLGALTDGPDEPDDCNFNGYTHLERDVWFRYANPFSFEGPVTISLCDTDFNGKLAVYGGACPTGPGQSFDCSDDACGTDPEVTFDALPGTIYRIRVGGFEGDMGSGNLLITRGAAGGCLCPSTCPPDLAPVGVGNGQVNVDDLLILIGAWGTAGAADLDGSGSVNVDDLLILIGAWGPC